MQQRRAACACLPVLLKKDNKNKAASDAGRREEGGGRALVLWVCLADSETVVAGCHCLRGRWVFECHSSSPPLSPLPLLPLLGPAQHLLHALGAGQGRAG